MDLLANFNSLVNLNDYHFVSQPFIPSGSRELEDGPREKAATNS